MLKNKSLKWLGILTSVLAGWVLTSSGVSAQTGFADRPIRIVVPYPAGGTTDLLARAVAPKLGERLGRTVVIDNRPGAGGVIGSQQVAKSPADGHSLVFASIASHGIIPALQTPPPYDPVADFVPITLVASTPNVLLANNNLPVTNLKELIALAKAKPGTINFGSTSHGGSPHMSGELFKSMAGIDIVHVPYKGGSPAATDLVGGQIDFYFANDLAAKPKNNNDQPCSSSSIAINSPGNQRLDDGKLFIIRTPIKIEIAADRASQNHCAKWRC